MGIIPFSRPAVQKEFFFNKTHIPGVGIRFQRNNIAEPAVAADRAGRTAFRGMTSFQPARQLA
jgi:hypothetical protein